MSEKKKTPAGPQYEGREEYYVDIDRYINEGMAGGSVFERDRYTNIEEARDLGKEEPPIERD
ncbi:hypothetical protein M3936_05370 [Sutcliffiella horikoshii]|uniref:hypothetical protein n=1 Tax=Sutcliffiella horikoshii TaxID=79883 RepID=UPI0007D057E2|nr:hypothetical protein [Sutcliffiella horikoshii]MCM3617013.1 hypothetical protein [Sutcliffiella horikoshii]